MIRFLRRTPKVKPRLVLHAGTHKTGTTSIQQTLRDNRDMLRGAGICYPDPGREPHPHLPAHNFVYRATLNGPQAMARERKRILKEFRASRCNVLILSEEGLSLPRDELQAFFEPWREVFEFRIVSFLRRQDRYVESLYSQYVRERKPIASEPLEDFLNVPKIAARFDYDTNLKRWDDFGPVKAVNYDLAKGDDLHRPVLEAAGSLLRFPPTPQSNVSPPSWAIEVVRQMNRLELDYDLGVVLNRLKSNPAPLLAPLKERKTMMGSTLRRAFLARMADYNSRLSANRGVTFNDDMPEEPDTAFHTDLPQDLLRRIARGSLEKT